MAKLPPSSESSFANVSNAAVLKATDRGWDEWFAMLDKAGAARLPHSEIVKILAKVDDPGAWWRQMITVGYEQARGLRVKHQKPEGFSVSASKTFPAPVSELYAHWTDARKRRAWLPDSFTIRTARADKSLRILWSDDETTVEVNFVAKGARKCQVAVQHNRLGSARVAETRKRFWRERLQALAELCKESSDE